MDNTTGVIFPLFGIMLLGYLFGVFKILGRESSAVLSRFVFTVALPALIFVSLSRTAVSDFFNWPFLGALGGGMLLMYILAFVVAKHFFPANLATHGLHALSAMFSSTGYIGLPLLLVVFGDEALAPGIVGAVITGACFMPIAIVLAEVDKGSRGARVISASLSGLIRNPMLVATVLGLSVSASGIEVPAAFARFCELLGGAYVPCALFAAGLFMVGAKIKGESVEIAWVVAAKLVIHPVITWFLAYHVFNLEGVLPAIAVIQAALPSGVPVFVIAQHYGVFIERSNAVIVISTALSLVTLSSLLIFLTP